MCLYPECKGVHWDMNSQDLPTKDGPLTVNEQVPVPSALVPSPSSDPGRLLPSPFRLHAWFPQRLTDLSLFPLSHINTCCLMLLMCIFLETASLLVRPKSKAMLLMQKEACFSQFTAPKHKCSPNSYHFWFILLFFFSFFCVACECLCPNMCLASLVFFSHSLPECRSHFSAI